MALDRLRHCAAGELSTLLDECAASFPAQAALRSALQTRGKLLRDEPGFCWGMLPIQVCDAAGGDPHLALPLAAATDCFISAADTFDDLQDADSDEALFRVAGLPTAIDVGMLLIFLSQLAIGRLLKLGVDPDKVLAIAQMYASAGARACAGQQRDLEQLCAVDLEEAGYLHIIGEKSASLVRCVCRAAALLATDDRDVLDAFADFGFNLGMALQISNDVSAVSTQCDRNDLRMGKCTLPIIYALECSPPTVRQVVANHFRQAKAQQLSPPEIERMRDILVSTGALHYATVIAGVYWERARDSLGRVPGFDGNDRSDLVASLHFG